MMDLGEYVYDLCYVLYGYTKVKRDNVNCKLICILL